MSSHDIDIMLFEVDKNIKIMFHSLIVELKTRNPNQLLVYTESHKKRNGLKYSEDYVKDLGYDG